MLKRSSHRLAGRSTARQTRASRASLMSLVSRTAPLAAATAAALLLAACKLPVHQDTSAPPPDPFNPAATQLLDNSHWQLVEWKNADGSLRSLPGAAATGAAAAAPGARPVTLDLSTATGQRRASGFSGCNRYTGAYVLKNGLLSFGQLAGTRMACVGAGGEIESAYLDALSHIARSGVQMRDPQALLLVLENGDRLTFASTVAAAAPPASGAQPAKQGE
ncbi:META domain-containing protein [Paraburkholderia tropica]|uniref:META domain-containing protein n=1 Tax=Paraburkholderia tropica TaxID=92647 RepID=UPI0038B8B4D5